MIVIQCNHRWISRLSTRLKDLIMYKNDFWFCWKLVGLINLVELWAHNTFDVNYIKVFDNDVWSMDHTLAPVIHAMLIELREDKHGVPMVDPSDVPPHISQDTIQRLISAVAPSEGDDIELATMIVHWSLVLDEMIWAFGEISEDKPTEDTFASGTWDRVVDENGYMKPGPNHTYALDIDGLKAYEERLARATTCFGKYYSSLWT